LLAADPSLDVSWWWSFLSQRVQISQRQHALVAIAATGHFDNIIGGGDMRAGRQLCSHNSNAP
jgi:hypothetical protein